MASGRLVGAGVPAVRSDPLSRQVAEAVRHMILVGQLLPGQVITQDQLAQMLGVSTMPVREALLRLSHEGFVESQRNRSFRVAHTSRRDVEDVYRTHAFLAGELAARAAARPEPDFIAELQRINEQWATADTSTLEDLNFQFHRAINLAADSPKLLHFLKNTIRFIPERFYALLPEWRASSERGHKQLTRALAKGDADAARKASERHVLEAGRLLIAHFTDTGYWSTPSTPATG